MNYRRRSKAFHVAVVRHVSQTCRREKAARVDRSMHSLPRYRLSLDLRVLARLETNRRRYVRLEEIARKTGLSPRYRSSCTRRPIYSLSLSLSRGSAVDLREMEEQGSDFHRRTSVFARTVKGRKRAVTERREPAQFLFLVARNGNAIGHFARPERLNWERGSCWLRR